MMKHILAVLAFMVASFGVQGLSHLVLNKAHYSAMTFVRPDPIIPLGLFVMALQGAVMSLALQVWKGSEAQIFDGVVVAAVFGVFLVSYISLAEPAKYSVPSVVAWVRLEITTGLIQFALFGVLLGLIHSKLS